MAELPIVKPISKKGLRIYRTEGNLFANLFLTPNRFEVHGLDNRVKDGPCLIVCNHTGAAKDVAIIYRIFNRMVFYCAMYYVFDRKVFNREIRTNYLRLLVPSKLKRTILDFFLTPIRLPFTRYISSRVTEISSIPLRAEYLGRGDRFVDHVRLKDMIQAYLLAGRAVVLMQADSKNPSVYHPYVRRFKKGAAGICQAIYSNYGGLEIPVIPVSIYGAEGLLTVGKRIIARVGEPMTIQPFLDKPNPVEEFTQALEKRVADLVRQDVEKYGMPKQKFEKWVRQELNN